MKKAQIFSILLLIISYNGYSQEETLLGDKEITHTGFGGPVFKFSHVNKNFALFIGGRGGWIINHTFVIGGGGYGLVNNIPGNIKINGETPIMNFGYGGLELEYISDYKKLLHYTIQTLIGAGGVGYRTRDNRQHHMHDNAFFVFEPAVHLNLNIAHFMRAGLGVSYRIILGVDYDELRNRDLSGYSANLTLKFGKF